MNLFTVDQLYTILYIILGICIICGYIVISALLTEFRNKMGKQQGVNMNLYAFLTKDNFRVEVKASSAIAGFNKLKSIPYFDSKEITVFYYQYPKNGFVANYDLKSLNIKQGVNMNRKEAIQSALNEFYQNINDDEDFKIQWYSKDLNILKNNFYEWCSNYEDLKHIIGGKYE